MMGWADGKGKRLRAIRTAEATKSAITHANHVEALITSARGSEIKLAHAKDHLQEIEELVEGWTNACLETIREEADPKEAGYFCAWIDAPEINTTRFSLLIGDCLQSFRSALDHIAFELASNFTIPMTDEVENDSSFPILSDLDKTGYGRGPHKWRSAQAKVRGIDPAAQAIIEGLQPYQRGHAYDTDPLWILGELTNIDKHRVLHVATRVMTGATMPVNGPLLPRESWSFNVREIGRADGQPFNLEIKGDIAAEGRTLVARWPMLPIDPRQPMRMNFLPALDIVFHADTPLVAERPVFPLLAEIHDHIVLKVFPPLIRFLE